MNTFFLNLKREYWEYRRTVVVVPIILSVLLVLASGMTTLYYDGGSDSSGAAVSWEVQSTTNEEDGSQSVAESKTATDDQSTPPRLTVAQVQQRTAFRFISIYLGIAWLTALFYLLSSLYSDRKDNSVLYWKSLPVSETRNVVSKLVFAGFGFSLFALLFAWAAYLLLMLLGWGAVNSLDGGESWQFIERTFDVQRFFIWPLFSIVAGVLWGAPYFCFALMVSAMSKRFPFMWFLIAPLVIAALEGIFLQSTNLIGFFTGHFPFGVLDQMVESLSLADTFHAFFIERSASLILGWVLSILFLTVAVWYRNNRFEL